LDAVGDAKLAAELRGPGPADPSTIDYSEVG
jgi:hypothetical protein